MSAKAKENAIEQMFFAFDGPAAFYHMLRKASDVEGFLNWLKEYHGISKHGKLFAGYKFLLDSIFKGFLDKIYENSAQQLNEDDVLFRGRFKGVQLSDIPNTCEETILLKRIWTHGKALSRAKTWKDLQEIVRRMNVDLETLARALSVNSS